MFVLDQVLQKAVIDEPVGKWCIWHMSKCCISMQAAVQVLCWMHLRLSHMKALLINAANTQFLNLQIQET